jgi:hypothetical protein
MSVRVTAQDTYAIGKWTENKVHELGFIYHDPHNNKTYMYVQFNDGAGGVLAINGTPVGFRHAQFVSGTDRQYEVTSDESETEAWAGVIVSDSNSADITDDYYGWIQLVRSGEQLDDVVMASGAAAGDLVAWAADEQLSTTTWASVGKQYLGKVGVALTSITTTTVGTTCARADVLVL